MLNTDIDFTTKRYRVVSNNYASISFANLQASFNANGTATVTYTEAYGDFPGSTITAYAMPSQSRNASNTGYDYIYVKIDSGERLSDKSVKLTLTGRWMLSGELLTGTYWIPVLILSNKSSTDL